MLSRLKTFLLKTGHYQPLNKIIISQQALTRNYHYLLKLHSNLQIAPVLKSNAYGHGIVQVGKITDSLHPPLICVDSLSEAYQLTGAGIKSPILILGYIDPQSLKTAKLPFSFAVFTVEMARVLSQAQPGAKAHLFIDTGMHREGITLDELPAFLTEMQQLNLQLEGVMSHFASADNTSSPQSAQQEKAFEAAVKITKQAGFNPKWVHLSASAGLFTAKTKICNLARVGKAFYGIDPLNKKNTQLQLALKLTSTLAEIKQLQKGDQVGYSATFTAERNLTIGILPIGYNDGVDRRLSNNGLVLVGGVECPIIGRVSMNITTIDLSKVSNPQIGQEVIVISDQASDRNSIISIAKACQTIPHEIMVHLNPSTQRKVL